MNEKQDNQLNIALETSLEQWKNPVNYQQVIMWKMIPGI